MKGAAWNKIDNNMGRNEGCGWEEETKLVV